MARRWLRRVVGACRITHKREMHRAVVQTWARTKASKVVVRSVPQEAAPPVAPVVQEVKWALVLDPLALT
jgi:hypothetical protein